MISPFSARDYNEIFKTSPTNPAIIISRESSTLEFKETFNYGNLQQKCLKTIVGFANNEGGYIVFGIKDKPHLLLGMDSKAEQRFDEYDPVKLTERLNNHFAPEIKWQMQKYTFMEKTYGVIYVYESDEKPVICIKGSDDYARESAIYYRYRALTTEIKYPEFKKIIDNKIEKNNSMWLETFKRIGKVGIDNLALIDTLSGNVIGKSGQFLISKELIPKLTFIREGQFKESEGAPALKLIGDIVPIDTRHTPIITKEKVVAKRGIRIDNIVLDFLDGKDIEYPMDYLTQMCYEPSSMLPIYYYISKITDKASIIPTLEKQKTRNKTKQNIINRITNGHKSLYKKISSSNTTSANERTIFRQAILEESCAEQTEHSKIKYFFQAICSLTGDEVKGHYAFITGELKKYFIKYYSDRDFPYVNDLRYAICYLDEVGFKNLAEV